MTLIIYIDVDFVFQLRAEADRALKLEQDLTSRTAELRVEKVTRQNVEASFVAAKDELKAEKSASRQLQSLLHTNCLGDGYILSFTILRTSNVHHEIVSQVS